MKEVTSPMSGKILEIKVQVGDKVAEEDEVATLEAMKMEIPVVSPDDGTVKEIKVQVGDSVEADTVLMTLE
ncbi:MAG: acetyl-CoA carboxylase biotin carboxyl carrier protein subunit [Deltaproteobacteria bacterium]|nr:acetyl-CoA carboxylase biotin carboxyl carrier protein subunit [Deltaproteobacteria bacterium]